MTTKPKPTRENAPPAMTAPAEINDINDLFRILRDNPQLRDQLRSLLLSQEILELPAALTALTQEVREFIAQQQAANEEQKRTNDAIFARLDRIEKDVAEAKADINELKSTVSGLVATTNRLEGRVSQLVGKDAERDIHANIHNMLRREQTGLRGVAILKSINQAFDSELADAIADAIAAGLLTRQEAEDIDKVDLITRGRLLGSQEVIHHAIEVSVVLDEHDVQRAVDRADKVSRVTKTPTFPVVVGSAIVPAARQLAQENSAITIITRQLAPPTP